MSLRDSFSSSYTRINVSSARVPSERAEYSHNRLDFASQTEPQARKFAVRVKGKPSVAIPETNWHQTLALRRIKQIN